MPALHEPGRGMCLSTWICGAPLHHLLSHGSPPSVHSICGLQSKFPRCGLFLLHAHATHARMFNCWDPGNAQMFAWAICIPLHGVHVPTSDPSEVIVLQPRIPRIKRHRIRVRTTIKNGIWTCTTQSHTHSFAVSTCIHPGRDCVSIQAEINSSS